MNFKRYTSVLIVAIILSLVAIPQLTLAQDTPPDNLPDSCVVDIVIMGDESSSINNTEFTQERNFILGILNGMPIAPGNTKAGVGFFEDQAVMNFPLTDDQAGLVQDVTDYVDGGGGTDLGEAIRIAQEELVANGRPSVQRVMVIITDGVPTGSTRENESVNAANARAAGTLIFAVGIGGGINVGILDDIATDPDPGDPESQFVFLAEFDTLQDFVDTLRNEVCEVAARIQGTIFVDVNQNGVQDADEIGAANVPVNLYIDGEVAPAQSTTTAADGTYVFNVSQGDYVLEVPPGDQALLPVIDFDQAGQQTSVISITTSEIISGVDGAVAPQLVCSFQSAPVPVASILPDASFSLLAPNGDLVPVDGVNVSVSLNPAIANLSGTNPVATVDGVATFSDLSVDAVGSYNLAGSIGDPLNIVADCSEFDVFEDGVVIGNEPPVANDDNYNTQVDTPISIPAPGVLANDSDLDSDPISVSLMDAVSAEGGTVTDDSAGGFTYTPPAGFTGVDTFMYQITDGIEFDTAVVTITVEDGQTTPTCRTIDFENLSAGTIVSNQIAGMTIATNDPAYPAMIFDSSNPTGGDLDLGTPNVDFGGPGRGAGGRTGGSGENTVALGNVLIISEDGDSSDPDDNAGGGQLIFTFDSPVTVESIVLLDLDDGTSANVSLFSETDAELLSVDVGPTDGSGDNGVYSADLNTVRVAKLVVTFPGSGAVASIDLCDDTIVTETPTPTPDPTDPPPAPVCAIDIMLVLDESNGISDVPEFEAERAFMLGLINALPIAPDSAHVGIGRISTFSEVTLPLTSDKAAVTDFMTNRVRGGGFSNIIYAIDLANEELVNNGRPGAPNVIVLISDGVQFPVPPPQTPPLSPAASADAARASGTVLYAIGVPDDDTGVPNTVTLQEIANDPDSQYYFQTDFNSISDVDFISSISTSLCPDVDNLPPVANDDAYVTDMDVQLNVPAPGILINDSDPDGDSITVSGYEATSVEGGTVVVNPDGSFTYTPPAGFTGSDSFQYMNTDGEFDSNIATVTIRIVGDETQTPTPTETTGTPEVTPPPTGTPEVTPPPSCSITHLELWNADTDTVIMTPLNSNDVIDVAAFGNARVTIVAVTNPTSVGSVEFTLFGPETRLTAENAVPYSLFGDNEAGDFYGEYLNPGDYTLTVRAFTEAYLDGVLCSEIAINFSVVDTTPTPPPAVTDEPAPQPTDEVTPPPVVTDEPAPTCSIVGFELWNADTDSLIGPLANNAVINLDSLNGANVTVVAVTNPASVGSVELSGLGQNRLENATPYSLFGDNEAGDFQGTQLAVGDYSVSAVAYTQAYADGIACAQASVSFSVVSGQDNPPGDDGPPPGGDGPPPGSDNPPGDDGPPPGGDGPPAN